MIDKHLVRTISQHRNNPKIQKHHHRRAFQRHMDEYQLYLKKTFNHEPYNSGTCTCIFCDQTRTSLSSELHEEGWLSKRIRELIGY